MHNHSFPKNILLIGFMGSGKSTVGRLLASHLGFRFVDTDTLIVEAAGMPISEIFATRGEAAFRDLETETLKSLGAREHLIIATGGGIVVREGNIPLLRQTGFVVELKADEETIFARVSRNTQRPLLQTENPRATIAKLVAERAPLYEAAAEFSIDTTTKTHAQVAEAIIHAAEGLTVR